MTAAAVPFLSAEGLLQVAQRGHAAPQAIFTAVPLTATSIMPLASPITA